MSPASSHNGLGQLQGMRDRRTRQAPTPRHPKPAPAADLPNALPPAEPVEPAEMPPPVEEPVVAVAEEPVAADTSTTGQVAVYITPAAVTTARRLRRPGVTNAHMALRAIEEMQPRLAELVKVRRRGEIREVLPGSRLFPSRSGTAAGAGDVRRMLWAVRLTAAEVAVVDALAAEAGATSRSELVSVAVEAYMAEQ